MSDQPTTPSSRGRSVARSTAGSWRTPSLRSLWRLAHAHGIKPAYTDNEDRRRRATPESLMAVLRAFGVPIDRPEQAESILRDHHVRHERDILAPVSVIWDDRPATIAIHLPADLPDNALIECELRLDDGHVEEWTVDRAHLPPRLGLFQQHTTGSHWLPLPTPLPHGYHTLNLSMPGRDATACVFASPPRACRLPNERTTGAFIPLYALHSRTSWGTGDLGDLRDLAQFTTEAGCPVLGTLPLLAQFLDEPCEPSPYSPVSRLFFNELFLDIETIPEFEASSEARSICNQPDFQNALKEINASSRVDYRRAMALKRQVLEAMSRTCWTDATGRRSDLERACEHDELLQQYARFRAVGEKHSVNWRTWPADLRERIIHHTLSPDDADPDAVRYHLYVQWQLRTQLNAVGRAMRSEDGGGGLYLDLPVGAHSNGFDAWRFERSFVDGASVGAPPDDLNSEGQNWGFAPLHPERMREDGHHCFVQAIRRHLEVASRLRIDHVMGLHRLYWVPDGFPATEGVYVRYPAEELYAILCIESHRHHAIIVGENLGTVPDVVNRTMDRHAIAPLLVGQFAFQPSAISDQPSAGPEPTAMPAIFQSIAPGAVASMNTHDTPTFAAFWTGRDIADRLELGQITPEQAEAEEQGRAHFRERIEQRLRDGRMNIDPTKPQSVHKALLTMLAASDASLVLITLEDLWGELQPQNVPGTAGDTNWTRKAARSLDEIISDPHMRQTMLAIAQQR